MGALDPYGWYMYDDNASLMVVSIGLRQPQ